MRLDDEEESSNFEVQGPSRGGFGFPMGGGGLPLGRGGLGCGSVVLIVVIALVMGVNPLQLLGGGDVGAPQQQSAPAGGQQQLTDVQRTALKVLGSTERRWTDIFAQQGERYPAPTLVFYDRSGMSGCGAAQSAMGPFYCPADRKLYIDTTFFDELRTQYRVPGDFPMAYVIAHEVGHHIQTVTGVADQVRRAQQRASRTEGNQLQVRMELQADCYAGVWAARDTNLLEPGDIEEGMKAANAIGDDTLQRASQGVVVPESFTHGSAEQRMTWLRRGLETGDPAQCDTFKG